MPRDDNLPTTVHILSQMDKRLAMFDGRIIAVRNDVDQLLTRTNIGILLNCVSIALWGVFWLLVWRGV